MRFATRLGLDPGQMKSVALTPQEHQMLTNLWRSRIGYGVDYARLTVDDIRLAAQQLLAGHPELLEAARVDGANEIQVFFKIMIPYIMGTIITVTTTIIIFTLKIFDVVMVMTGGQFGTHVIATQFYRQYFTNRNFGFGSAIAIILLIAVIPVMAYNLRQFGEREAF